MAEPLEGRLSQGMYKPSEYGENWTDVPSSRRFHMMPEGEMAKLEESIKSEGIQKPVTVDRWSSRVVDGHHRASIALRHGLDIPVEYQE